MGVKIDAAVSWCLQIAKDESHGYDQNSRWGPDYDCSSFLIQAWQNAGVPVKSRGATYTGNMVDIFMKCGFEDVTSKVKISTGSGMIKGDVVWRNGHTEMVSRPGYLVGAHINERGTTTGGATGDQSGKEIYERTYYAGTSPWTKVLRYIEQEQSESNVSKSDVVNKNAYLSLSQMKINARYLMQEFLKKGWTLNAIAGMLGNMQVESYINPGIWQNLDSGNTSLGFGLVQWTPATKLKSWCSERWYSYTDIDAQIERIVYELKNGIQYYATDSYPESFKEFSISTKTPEYLAYAFLNNYERPTNRNQPDRQSNARFWYDFLLPYMEGNPETPDEPDVPEIQPGDYQPFRGHFKFFMTNNQRRQNQWTKRNSFRKLLK